MNNVVTGVVAVIGALTGVGGLVLGIVNYARDRSWLKVSFATDVYVLNHPDLDSDRTWG